MSDKPTRVYKQQAGRPWKVKIYYPRCRHTLTTLAALEPPDGTECQQCKLAMAEIERRTHVPSQ